MKNTLINTGVLAASVLVAQAATVYTEDFSTSVYDEADNDSSNAIFFGGANPGVSEGDWHGARTLVFINNGSLTFGTQTNTARFRGAAAWLDSSAWELGIVTVTFDVSEYTDGTNDFETFFQAYAADGVNATDSAVSLDLHQSAVTGVATTATGSAAIAAVGSQFNFSANGTDLTATFDFTGQENIALVFANSSGTPEGGEMGTFNIDNISVDTVPEPSSAALLGLGGLALLVRRRK